MFRNRVFTTCAAIAVAAATVGPVWAEGEINVAIIGEADTFDPVISTKDIVATVTQHFYETLYTFDANWAPTPLLADGMPQVSEDGLTYRITIRDGVQFHDGSPLEASDVAASLLRWVDSSARARSLKPNVSSIVADGSAVVITLTAPYSPLVSLLAFNSAGAVISPAENIGADGLIAPIGTGPYQVGEHKPDQYLLLTRFDGYVSPEGEISNAAGARNQVPDEIRFIPVADGNTRLEGLLSGQFDFAESISAESYARLEDSDTVEPVLLENAIWPMFAINHKEGLMTNPDLRKAVQAALSTEDMMIAAVGDDTFFQLDGSLFPDGHFWNNDAGIEVYNQADAAKAREFLAAGGYDGTPLRILTSHQYEFHFKMAEVAKYYLEAAGMTVELDVVDWATLGQKRNNPAEWDIFITHSPFLPEPALVALYSVKNRIGWANADKEAVLAQFSTETDPAARQELFAKIQGYVMDDIPFLKIGNIHTLRGKSVNLTGVPSSYWPIFWNADVSE